MRKDLRIVIAVAVWAVCTACNGCFGCTSPVDQPGSTLPKSCDERPDPPLPQKLDVVFVVDNSGSMAEEQAGVAIEMTDFVNSLRVAGGVAQDIRVGVITTSVYRHVEGNPFEWCNPTPSVATDYAYCTQSGGLQPTPDANPDGGFPIRNDNGPRVLESSDPEFVPKFARLIQQGINGSGQETPFEALRLAFSSPLIDKTVASKGTKDFLRDGARLLIVVLSDEDDCSEEARPAKVTIGGNTAIDYCTLQANSLTPVSVYHDFLSGLKDSTGALKEVIYTAIAPVSVSTKSAMGIVDALPDGGMQVRNIDCKTSNEPGYRHRQMAEMFFSDLSNLDSICNANYKATLQNIANLAGVSQTLEIKGVPDEHVLIVTITRADGSKVSCTVDSGGITYEMPTATTEGRIHFESTCKRRRDDTELIVDRLCVY